MKTTLLSVLSNCYEQSNEGLQIPGDFVFHLCNIFEFY